MPYDEALAARLRETIAGLGVGPFDERKMFGGLSFMLEDRLCCGVIKDELIARVGPQAVDDAISQPGARPMDFTGRPMSGWVQVAPEGFATDDALRGWVVRCVAYVSGIQEPKKRTGMKRKP